MKKIALIGVATSEKKSEFWMTQAKKHAWNVVLTGSSGHYDWASHGTKIKYLVEAIEQLPEETEYVLISDTYDSFVNTNPETVAAYFVENKGKILFENDLKHYEWFRWLYPLFPNYFSKKLHNYIHVNGRGCYFQSGIVGGHKNDVLNFYRNCLQYVKAGRREQASIRMMLTDHPEILNSLKLTGKYRFMHLFTRIYMFNFRSVARRGDGQFEVDRNIPFVIHCPGALRPTITSYFWQYFISDGVSKNWRISPFIRTSRS
ncbi:MAG: hypothetical protein JXQ90_21465 [Cyclobacteriaceae bacterium]